MRSIRLSLIVYILVLLGLALGGVSWFVYQTSAQALRGQEASTIKLFEETYKEQVDEAKNALRDRIQEKAKMLAKRARYRFQFEFLFPIANAALVSQPQGFVSVPLWYLSLNAKETQEMFKLRDIVIGDTDDIVLAPDQDNYQDQEYFQIYNDLGQTQQRSERLLERQGTRSLTADRYLAKKVRDNAESEPDFEEIEPEPNWKLVSVTFRAKVKKAPFTFMRPWAPPIFPKKGGKGLEKGGKGPGGIRNLPSQVPPVAFIQYASETSQHDLWLSKFADDRDDKIATQKESTLAELNSLRWRLLWVCLGTFAAIVIGATVLIRLGLAPLAFLSDSVSKISEKDFRLRLPPRHLPRELQPIADRLTGTLDQLQKAFAREKQAAADISHELRTPLAAMMTTVELSLRKSRSPQEYREMLADIRSSGSQLAHLVERLLALARLDAGVVALKDQDFDACDIAKECTNLIRPLADARGLALTLKAPEPAPLRSDPDKLREILNNLLHNAVEYNRPEGSIDLEVARVNGHLRLAVRDTGIGITPEQRDHLFERFYRADPSRHADTPHAGLGLAIVKSYVDLMGGTIGVDCNGRGSTFTIDLPIST
jgi:signal transduction histidine kinase